MNAKEFVIFLRQILNRDMTPFIANMEKPGIGNKCPHEWIIVLVKWLELSNEENARRSYKEYYK